MKDGSRVKSRGAEIRRTRCAMQYARLLQGLTGNDEAYAASQRTSMLRQRQSWRSTTVLSVVNPYSASKPFSRPWPECFTPPKGSSTPPPAP
jgi:hypothetical protein